MAKTFHHFSDLPAELRLQIWEDCIRPDESGVHFFTVDYCLDPSPDQSGVAYALKTQHIGLHGMEVGVLKETHAAAPLFGAGSRRSWTENNPSTYLLDAGLWTACRESREVMEKHFQTIYWREKRYELLKRLEREPSLIQKLRHTPEYDNAPGTGRFRHNGEDWCFSVFPNRDLFCVQYDENSPFSSLPPATWLFGEFGNSTFASTRLGFYGVKSLAFEYDASWSLSEEERRGNADFEEMSNEDNARGFFLSTLKEVVSGNVNTDLYLIDRNIRLKPDARGCKTFYGNGCKYLVSMFWEEEAYVGDVDMSAPNLIGDINLLGYDYYTRVQNESVMTTGSGFDYFEIHMHVQVLAVQEV